MKNFFAVSLAIAATLGLAACTDKAQNEVGEAANAMTADGANALGEAGDDLEAATNSAMGGVENGMDSMGAMASNAADATGDAMKDTGDAMKNAVN